MKNRILKILLKNKADRSLLEESMLLDYYIGVSALSREFRFALMVEGLQK